MKWWGAVEFALAFWVEGEVAVGADGACEAEVGWGLECEGGGHGWSM